MGNEKIFNISTTLSASTLQKRHLEFGVWNRWSFLNFLNEYENRQKF